MLLKTLVSLLLVLKPFLPYIYLILLKTFKSTSGKVPNTFRNLRNDYLRAKCY